MRRIDVRALVGDTALTLEDGQKLYEHLHPALLAEDAVELDFTGIDALGAPFFNAAIGHLVEDIAPDDLNRLLRVGHLLSAGELTLRRVIENAKRYYGDPCVRRAVDETMAALAEEAKAHSRRPA